MHPSAVQATSGTPEMAADSSTSRRSEYGSSFRATFTLESKFRVRACRLLLDNVFCPRPVQLVSVSRGPTCAIRAVRSSRL